MNLSVRMRTLNKARLARFWGAFLAIGVTAVFLTCLSGEWSFSEIGLAQGRLNYALPPLGTLGRVSQTFVAVEDSLSAVEVLLVRYADPPSEVTEYLTMQLRADAVSRS